MRAGPVAIWRATHAFGGDLRHRAAYDEWSVSGTDQNSSSLPLQCGCHCHRACIDQLPDRQCPRHTLSEPGTGTNSHCGLLLCLSLSRALLLPLLTITLMVAVAWAIHPELSALCCVVAALYSGLSALCSALSARNSLI
jgi:hypothetical protein